MGEQNRAPNLRPIAPAGTSFYILDLNSISSGTSETIPLLFLSDVEQRSGQYIVPLLPSKPRESVTHSISSTNTNRTTVNNSRSGQVSAESSKTVNIVSNELITTRTQEAPLAQNVQDKCSNELVTPRIQEASLAQNVQDKCSNELVTPRTKEARLTQNVQDKCSNELVTPRTQEASLAQNVQDKCSNELVTPRSQEARLAQNVQDKYSKKQTHSKYVQVQRYEKQKNEQKIYKNKTETQKIPNYIHIADRVLPPRAIAVLPKSLHIRRDNIFPHRTLPPRVRFGPVQGVVQKIFPAEADELVCEASFAEKPIFLMRREENSVTHINVSDKERSNWISLLPLGKKTTANVWIYEEDNELYGITTEVISSRTPLTLGYSKKYATEHKLSSEQPVLDLQQAMAEEPEFWCFECRRSFASDILLLRHANVVHKDERPPRKKLYCKYCCRTFGRLFLFRQHTKICSREHIQSSPSVPEIKPKNLDPKPDVCIAKSTEDIRTPSDESFQNYTSVLDFSMNLFDPDRISSLDFSGSSKSDPELKPYSKGLQPDDLDNNEDYSIFCNGLKFVNNDKKKIKIENLTSVSCHYCKQKMTRNTRRRHLRDCPARLLECECGKKFTSKDAFAKHVHLKHTRRLSDTQNKEDPNKTDTKEMSYKCDECKVKFKRRGMLVNHLWRVHDTSSAKVPLERRVRHYPCSACPKIYRTAAKRDRHVNAHHPGLRIRAAPIEGERRRYQPAKCPACPREYATRSKMLQHMRAQHPELAVSTKPEPPPV